MARNKCSVNFNISSQVFGFMVQSFFVCLLLFCLFLYQMIFCVMERKLEYLWLGSWFRGKKMTLWYVIKSVLCPGFRSKEIHCLLTLRLCPLKAKQNHNVRSPHHLSRPASWIKLRKEPLFRCNFDIRLARKVPCSGFSDTILTSPVILAKKDMKVIVFHRRAWVELKTVQFGGDLLYNIWNH